MRNESFLSSTNPSYPCAAEQLDVPRHRLRILHLSDLHWGRPEGRWRRAEVLLGEAWEKNLEQITKDGQPVDLLCVTGDLAFSGNSDEYEAAAPFLRSTTDLLEIPSEHMFLVPGNHDICRSDKKTWEEFKRIRGDLDLSVSRDLSQWVAGYPPPPRGIPDDWLDKLLKRQEPFWAAVEHLLGRPALLPKKSPHRLLGYRVSVQLERLPFPIQVVGLDTSWLSGDDNDEGKLWLTDDQVMLLLTDDDGRRLPGLRIAMSHHPLEKLRDEVSARRHLGESADLFLRGHLHQTTLELRPRSEEHNTFTEIGAGCLYEHNQYANGFLVIDLETDGEGRVLACQVRVRGWTKHWFDDNGLFPGTKNGRFRLFGNPPVRPDLAGSLFFLDRPSLRERFVGRDRELDRLHEMLLSAPTTAVVVVGQPGVGKSQLAIEYAHRRAVDYPGGVFWIDAQHTDRLSAIRRIAEWVSIDLSSEPNGDRAVSLFWREMRKRPRSLVILDNFPEAPFHSAHLAHDGLGPWLPAAGDVHVLATCRQSFVERAESMELDVLDEAGALRLLTMDMELPGKESSAALELARLLSGLPLALELVRAYVRHHPPHGYSDYLQVLRGPSLVPSLQRMADAYREPLPAGGAAKFLAVFERSYVLCSPLAQSVLLIASCLAPEPIPRDLVDDIVLQLDGVRDVDPLHAPIRDAINELRDNSLAKWIGYETSVEHDATRSVVRTATMQVHRLVLEYVRHKLSDDKRRTGVVEAADSQVAIRMRIAQDQRFAYSAGELREIAPHAANVYRRAVESGRYYLAQDLALSLSQHEFHQGLFEAARTWAINAREANDRLGDDASPGARVRATLAQAKAIRQATSADGAVSLFKAAAKEVEGAAPELRAEAINELGLALKDVGKPLEALALFEKAHALVGDGEGDGLDWLRGSILDHIGVVLGDLGRFEEARTKLELALRVRRSLYGPDHPIPAFSMSNLAHTMRNLGFADESLELSRSAAETLTRRLGPSNPFVVNALRNMAMALRDLHRLPEARAELERALVKLGGWAREDARTSKLLGGLSRVLADLGEAEEAKRAARRGLAIVRGLAKRPDHPGIGLRLSDVAYALVAAGELDEAEGALHKAIDVSRKAYAGTHPSGDHPDVATHLRTLAEAYVKRGHLSEAQSVARNALEIHERCCGPDNPRTTRSREALAEVERALAAGGSAGPTA